MSHPTFLPAPGTLAYGTEYWFDEKTTSTEIRADFARMRAMGMNSVRIFLPVDELAPDAEASQTVAAIFAAARDQELFVCPTFPLDLPPAAKAAIGLDPALNVPRAYLLDDPLYREPLGMGLRRIVKRYAVQPALWSWILWNEPSRRPFYPPPPPVWSAFRRWLEEQYSGSLAGLLAAWYPTLPSLHPFADFTEILPAHIHAEWSGLWQGYESGRGYQALVPPLLLRLASQVRAQSWDAFPIWRDWLRFNTDALTDSIQWLAAQVRAIDPAHPTQVNPDGFLQNQAAVSRDLPALAASVDLFGASLHPGHHLSAINCEDQMPEAVAYYTQSIASAARGRPALITELQAGPNTWSGNRHFTPDSNDLILWSMTALGSGLKGIIYWLWKPRRQGWEAGEWGLLQHNDKNTPRALGTARLGRFFAEHGAWLSSLKPRKPAVAILRSPESETLGLIESLYGVQPVDQYQPLSEYGCFRALWRNGISAEFITPREAQTAGALSSYRCLFIPFGEALSAETAAAVERYARSGGWVYAETPFAVKTPDGMALGTQPGYGLDQIFTQAVDIWPARRQPEFDTPFGFLHSELFIQPLESGEHEVVAELSEGYDLIIERSLGAGRALYAGTCLTLYCGKNCAAENEEAFLASFALRAGAKPWFKSSAPQSCAAYLLEGSASDACVLLNYGPDEVEIEAALPRAYKRADPLLGRGETWVTRRTLTITLPARSAEVVRLDR